MLAQARTMSITRSVTRRAIKTGCRNGIDPNVEKHETVLECKTVKTLRPVLLYGGAEDS